MRLQQTVATHAFHSQSPSIETLAKQPKSIGDGAQFFVSNHAMKFLLKTWVNIQRSAKLEGRKFHTSDSEQKINIKRKVPSFQAYPMRLSSIQ